MNRLPQIALPGGLQNNNDPNNFQYIERLPLAEEQFSDQNVDNGSYVQNEPSTPPHNYHRRELSSPNKTGGLIQLTNLQHEDVSNEPFIGRDAAVVIEGEMRQFDNRKQDKVQRYVESLVTGNFMRVQKEINTQIEAKDEDEKSKKLQSSREFFDKQMKEAQRQWVNRANKLFNMFLGLLAGMSLMHLLAILSQSDKDSFLRLYSKVANIIQIVFMVFSSFCLILSISLTMIYHQKSDEKMRNMDPFRLEFRQHYIVSLVCTIIISICQALLYINPVYTNRFYYWQASLVTDQHIQVFKGLAAASDVLFMITWLLASAFNKASISDMDYDPDELEQQDIANNSTVDTE